MHVFYYGNEMLDKNSLEWRVYTGKEKTSGRACGPNINSVIDQKKKQLFFSTQHIYYNKNIRIMLSDVQVFEYKHQ